jgi:hypothetical protein
MTSDLPGETLSEARLSKAIERFVGWLDRQGVASYDPYDIWGTRYGVLARRIYYARGKWGLPLIAPVVLFETLVPGLRGLFVSKQRFATAEAQLVQGWLNLYRSTREEQYLRRAEAGANNLLQLSIPGYRGHCWGYPFDWQNNSGLWRRNTPFITATPYCFEAFAGLADATGRSEYDAVAESIARFVSEDLHDTDVSDRASAGSYSPYDRGKVVNASAYRAFVLFTAWNRFGVAEYERQAGRNLRFVLDCQQEDGSWLYAIDSPGESFVDHFHTCFVLKNLHKLNRFLASAEVTRAIEKGWAYYRRALFHGDGVPKSFAIEPRAQLAQVEVYNFAEAVTLGVLLADTIPGALEAARRLASIAIADYQLADGHFVTRVYRGGFRHTVPFLRWPQAQVFLALTNMLRAAQSAPPGS